jgi:hypothetical protein
MKQRKPGPKADDLAWLYLLERDPAGTRGTLKIGVTSRPKSRMRTHKMDAPYKRFHFCASGPRLFMLEVERACAASLGRMGKRLRSPTSEEFSGIEFDVAVLMVRDRVSRMRESLPELTARRAELLDGSAAWRLFRSRLLAEAV